MRNLTRAQKKLLNSQPEDVVSVKTLPYDVWEKLQEMNDTEILYQNVDNFLRDRAWNRTHNIWGGFL